MAYTQTDYFINPYTFVPIPETEPCRKPVERGNKTGVIECSIEIKSPTFIPNTTKSFKTDTPDHYFNEFYSYDDLTGKGEGAPQDPVIPGSEIRGMVRNIYEQLTNSCFLEVDENNILTMRSALPRKAGLVKFDKEKLKWELFRADKFMLNSGKSRKSQKGFFYEIKEETEKDSKNPKWYIEYNGKKYFSGSKVNFTKGEEYKNRKGYPIGIIAEKLGGDHTGYLLLWGNINNKHHNSIFTLQKKAEPIECKNLNQAVENFKIVSKYYEENKDNKNSAEYKKITYELKADGEYYPVWFEEITDENGKVRVYLSPACISRKVFDNSLKNILGSHNKCTNIDNLCPACRLFGMIGEKGSNTGRVRICDTHEFDKDSIKWGEKSVLPILGTPRISATEFYLHKPDEKAKMWNHDYWVEQYGSYNTKSVIHYEMPMLSGRKVYWHGKFDAISKVEKGNMNCTVRPIIANKEKPDKKEQFKFKVYFEDLTPEELEKLIFCLRLNNEGIHKIGKGKPIGMGDIKVTVDNIKYRNYEIKDNKITVSLVEQKGTSIHKLPENDMVKQILAYTKTMSDNKADFVAYPTIFNPTNDLQKAPIFKWFLDNRGTVQSPTIINRLYSISEIMKDENKIYITKYPKQDQLSYNPKPNNPLPQSSIKLSGGDIEITCRDCGEIFLFTIREQEFYKGKGYNNRPASCKFCRDKKKLKR